MHARRPSRTPRATPGGVASARPAAALLLLAGSLAAGAPAAAQRVDEGLPGPAPLSLRIADAPAPRNVARLSSYEPLAASLSYTVSEESAAPAPRTVLPRTRRQRAAAAFALELREESLRFRDAQPWTNVPPELQDDALVREVRERGAERILGEAVAEALEALVFRQDPEAPHRLSVITGSRTGFEIDGTPSWRVRKRGERFALRLDVPLTPRALRLHAWHLVGGENGVDRIGGTFSLDPWDESARLSFRLEF